MSVEKLYSTYSDHGFLFEDELVTRYAVSLYSKPFVILSGISGTGKSKLAQLFEPPILGQQNQPTQQTSTDSNNDDYIILRIRQNMLDGDGRGNFKFSDLATIFEDDEIILVNEKIEEYKTRGVDDNITDTELIEIVAPDGQSLKASVYLQRASSPLLRVRFRSKRGSQHNFDSRDELAKRYKEGDILKLEKIAPKKLRITSINNEEVVATEANLHQSEIQSIENKLFVSVRNDWTDSSEIFGFYNVIEDKYHIPQTLKFLLKALEYPEIPFFLILDEMNLSKVEHYFSDFLSCIESRINKNGEIVQENIHLHSKGSFADSDDMYFDLVPSKLQLPLNLYVTGTVNIDESTYMFSPKVLDRANVIEFNEVNLDEYENNSNQTSSIFKLSKIPKFGHVEIASREHFIDSNTNVKSHLIEINKILEEYNMHFGYRTVNEICLFIKNCIELIDDSSNENKIIELALDYQIYQKILPKLHGSFNQLDEPLRKLIAYLLNDNVSFDTLDSKALNEIDLKTASFPNAIKKLRNMHWNLKTNGFASYLE